MSRLIQGITFIAIPIMVNIVVAIIATDAASNVDPPPGCNTSNNLTTCEDAGKTSFLFYLFAVTIAGIPGLPIEVNVFYVLIMGGLLTVGIILVVLAFIPLTAG